MRKAYRISIHESYREGGKVKKKQTVICTIGYYDLVDWGSWIGDYVTGSRWKEKVESIGLPEDELVDLIYKKFQPVIGRVEAEFRQTEEYRAREEHRQMLKEHKQRVETFKGKYDTSEDEYNHCYNVSGNLCNADALKKVRADYKAKREYEQRSWQQSRGYYERFFNKNSEKSESSYGENISDNYSEDNKAMLKKFYRTLSKVYHPDSNPGSRRMGYVEGRGREDFEEPEEICLEISCCSQENGFISGFKYGVAFMMECLEWPGQG